MTSYDLKIYIMSTDWWSLEARMECGEKWAKWGSKDTNFTYKTNKSWQYNGQHGDCS